MKAENKLISDFNRIDAWKLKNKSRLTMTKEGLAYSAKIDEQANEKKRLAIKQYSTRILEQLGECYVECEDIHAGTIEARHLKEKGNDPFYLKKLPIPLKEEPKYSAEERYKKAVVNFEMTFEQEIRWPYDRMFAIAAGLPDPPKVETNKD